VRNGELVRVYWNTVRHRFSVLRRWRVQGYRQSLVLSDVVPTIRASGLARAKATCQRNVFAFLKGCVSTHKTPARGRALRFSIDVGNFIDGEGRRLVSAEYVRLTVSADGRPSVQAFGRQVYA